MWLAEENQVRESPTVVIGHRRVIPVSDVSVVDVGDFDVDVRLTLDENDHPPGAAREVAGASGECSQRCAGCRRVVTRSGHPRNLRRAVCQSSGLPGLCVNAGSAERKQLRGRVATAVDRARPNRRSARLARVSAVCQNARRCRAARVSPYADSVYPRGSGRVRRRRAIRPGGRHRWARRSRRSRSLPQRGGSLYGQCVEWGLSMQFGGGG